MGESYGLISVIIPIYKTENYLRRCVNSVLEQSYKNLEVILVNDGSPDSCAEICDEFAKKDSRVRVIHKDNDGVSSARNRALDVCEGLYVAFVDSDDYVKFDYFSELIKGTIYDVDIVVSGSTMTSGVHSVTEVKENYYNWGGFIGPCEKLYKREKIRGIRFREDLVVGEDIVFNLEVLNQVETIFYTPYQGYTIVENPESLTRGGFGRYNVRFDEEWQKAWGEIHSAALRNAGIPKESTNRANVDGCSVWIFQKIRNYCYSDCPHRFSEKVQRIARQLKQNRDIILQTKSPVSPKTYFVIRLCLMMRSPYLVYFMFKLLIVLRLI